MPNSDDIPSSNSTIGVPLESTNPLFNQDGDVIANITPLILSQPPEGISLPSAFPLEVQPSSFLIGDRVRWKFLDDTPDTDWGCVVGKYYAFASHKFDWRWRYIIWLDDDSPSKEWLVLELAWEDDLEPLENEGN